MKRQNRTWAMVGKRSAGARRAEASRTLRETRRLARFDELESRTLLAANVVEYPLGQTGGGAVAITAGFGSDTNLYFTLPSSNSLGVYNPVAGGAVNQYSIPTTTNSSGALAAGYSGASAITAGSDGNIYFLETAANQIGEFNTTTKTFSEFPLLATPNAGLTGITNGPDGNIWFTEYKANQIGEFNVTTHAITEFAVPTTGGEPDGITSDPTDKLLWFTEYGTNNVGSINATTHLIQEYNDASATSLGNGAIVYDSSTQSLYFLETQAKLIGTLNPSTATFGATITGLNDTDQTDQLAVDSAGNVWFTEGTAGQVGVLNTTISTVTKQITAAFNSNPEGITAGADGNMWYTTAVTTQLHPVSLGGLAQTVVAIPTTSNGEGASFLNAPADTATAIVSDSSGNLWFTQPGNDSVGEFNATSHSSTLIAVPGASSGYQPQQITLDSTDGSIWFTESQSTGTGSKVGRINPTTGAITNEIATPTASAGVQGIAYNSPVHGNGSLYFTEETAGRLGVINPTTDVISDSVTVPATESKPYGVVADSTGNVWVTMFGSGTVDRFDPTTASWLATPITLASGAAPEGITLGPDGNLWVAESGTGKVAVINPSTQSLVTEFAASATGAITTGADGNVWITRSAALASIAPGTYTQTPYTVPDATPLGVAAGTDGNLYFTGQGTGLPTYYPNVIGAVTTAAASQEAALAFTTQPPADVTAGVNFGLVVAVENPAAQIDNLVNNYTPLTGSVTLSLGTNPGGSSLSGTLTAPVINGVAVFSGLSLNNNGTGYTIDASYNGLATAISNPFNVSLAATRLHFTTEPAATVPDGQGFSVAVSAEDANGNVDTSYNGPVSITLGNNPGGATFNAVTVGASQGVATFTNLLVNKIGSDYTLVAAVPGVKLTSATSSGFNVIAGAVSQLIITTEPASTATPGTPLSMTVKAEDVNNTLVTSYSGTLTVSLINNTTGATLENSVPVTFINGVANVSGLMISTPGVGYNLVATSGAFSATSTAITVTTAPTSQFVLTVQPAGDATAGQAFDLTVQAEDPYSDTTTDYTGTVQLSSTDFAVALPSYTFTAADDGVHTFFITLDTAGMQTITATDITNTAITGSTNETVDPGATTQFVASETTTAAIAGSPVMLTFTAEDAEGNTTPAYTGTVELTSSDTLATLPASDYTFTLGDAGAHTFNLTMGTAGIQTVTLSDTSDSTITGTSDLAVSPGPTSQIAISVPATEVVGAPFKATFTAEDSYGNPTPDYLGAIHVSSNDVNAVLPSNYTFTNSDAGVHTLTVTPGTVSNGSFTPSLTVTDTSNPNISGTTTLTVVNASTSLLLSTSTPSTTYGQNTQFTATVGQTAGLPVPTGTIQFAYDGTPLGNPVTLVNGSATAPMLTTLNAGSHTITAAYSGDSTYSAGSTNPVIVVVSQAPLVFTVQNVTRTYGQANPVLVAVPTGFVNNDTAATAYTGSPILSTLAASSSTPGVYAITISGGTLASMNYDVSTLIPGSLTINKAPITVTATSITRPYGLTNPTFTYTLSGLTNNDLGNVITGAPSLTTNAVAASPAGTYSINVGVGSLSAANYTFSNLVNGTLTVTGASQPQIGDLNGDGVSDLAVYRPSVADWFVQYSGGGGQSTQFGDPKYGDVPVPGNYLGTGKNQLAVFRPTSDTWIIQTAPGQVELIQFGDPKYGDIPAPGDYLGNGKTQLAVFRPGTDTWIIQTAPGQIEQIQFGDPKYGDQPVPGDYLGAGKDQLAVFRPTTDTWIIQTAPGQINQIQFGDPSQNDMPAPGNYDGGTITDLAVYRPGYALWIIQESTGTVTVNFGDPAAGDLPAAEPADYAPMITPQISASSVGTPIPPTVSGILALAPDTSTTTSTKPKSQDLWLTAIDELSNGL